MPLKAVLTSLDGVDDALRDLYKADDVGRYVLQVEGVDEMPAVQGLRRKNGELLDEKRQLASQLEAFGDATPEQIEEWKKGSRGTGSEAKRVEQLEAQLEAQKQKAQEEIESAKSEAEGAVSAAESYFTRSEIARAAQANRASPALLEHELRKHLKVQRSGPDDFEIQVVGPDGQPKLKDSQGNPYTVDDLVASYKDHPEFGKAFDIRKGSDAPPGSGGGDHTAPGTFDRNDPMAWGQNAEAVVKGEASAV